MTNEQFIFIMARICADLGKIYYKINEELLENEDVSAYLNIENFGIPNVWGETPEDWRVSYLHPLLDFIHELEEHIEIMKKER